ncbi:FAD-binding and (Fe-S)-binding domain-containing protein [Solitalea lacus]|uniref:FAD-binding and (Fe-S)-binding domain-containing protein n=1 Tax=Solitalea lacus TaxID=2911172 RepID=UPI001EDA090D|nr:FAD-binding and (Fe-S)-binding domain-containing protein [Solitalea lacus]UKJ07245.1 FAD-binding oxidoreductase [Solitalea lacus]
MEIGKELESILPKDRIKTRLIDLVSYASDAGFYHLQPKAIVLPQTELEIIRLFEFSHQNSIPLTFRTGGTSLSGQSITDGILVDLSQYWDRVTIEEDGITVRVQPGVIGAMVNARLKNYKKKIGPDPSSINSAMMGGILSNNSSGMCCGVVNNSYHTTKYIRFILPNGKVYSTERKEDYGRFEIECPEIYEGIKSLRQSIVGNERLTALVRRKYKTKNTVGYSVNSFIDYNEPLDILAHLLIGAEGTLGFIAEAVLNTIADYPYKATSLLYFQTIYDACQAIVPLTVAGAEAVELMDRASLRSIEHIKGVPEQLKSLPETAAALLVEFQDNSQDELKSKVDKFLAVSSGISLINAPQFTTNQTEQDFLWKLRKGMFPAVGAVRASGTTVILEDIAFPVDKLGDAILDLQQLFTEFRYDNAIIFGHAKDGNIHFVVTQAFDSEAEIERYDRFLNKVVELVVNKYDGTLKAEHGTGRNMAPFIETEWGGELYEVMKQLKSVVDPHNLLNPGVIINADKKAHIKNLKDLPQVEEEVDKCIECGYCEHKCPSRNLTMTPRRRIVVRRALQNLKKSGDSGSYQQLLQEYQYDGLDTCAVDGLCATACPVDINTGDLVKRLRRENHGDFSNSIALFSSKNFTTVSTLVKAGLTIGDGVNKVFGKTTMTNLTGAIKKVVPAMPLWSEQLKVSNSASYKNKSIQLDNGTVGVVYFPTCISRVMGASVDGKKNTIEAFMSVAHKVGITLHIPEEIEHTCCGQIYSSKGFAKAYEHKSNEMIEDIWRWTDGGKWPVVLDISSCTYTLHHCRSVLTEENKRKFDKLNIIDSVDFLADYVLPKAQIVKKKKEIVLHPVCSLQKMGLVGKFQSIANQLAESVTTPLSAGCCGMAGDRGFLFPELTKSATHIEAIEVKCKEYEGYYSSAKTCEMAMSEAVGKNYESIVYLLDECL